MTALVPAATPGSPRWFAAHEARLMWRDFSGMMTAGRTFRAPLVAACALAALALLHVFAWRALEGVDVAARLDRTGLLVVSGALVMMFSLMLSQAIESVTRAYFGRSDLDLLLSSPAPVAPIFAVRAGVIGAQTGLLSLAIAAPVANVLAWRGGAGWLFVYPALAALGVLATALALLVTAVLFRTVGAKRTRLTAQIVAATVGAGFVIALQACAILGGQGLSRIALLSDPDVLALVPDAASPFWLPARAASGGGIELCALLALVALAFVGAGRLAVRSFARDALNAASVGFGRARTSAFRGFRKRSDMRSQLRRKEWTLLARDPWLLSQSLQQVLYMLPPALMLYMNFGADRSVLFVVVPVIVMAAGQLAGGLAWLAISGEDAHELIATAPVAERDVLLAKMEAVGFVVLLLLAPFAVAASFVQPTAGLYILAGGGLAAASATTVQMWFRAQANRSFFRRRQVSSRVATIAEAMVSILWAAVTCLAIAEAPAVLLALPLVALAATFAVAWTLRPARA